jgi:hypothetical protein
VRRRIVHFNVTESPSAAWTGQQIVEAFPWDTTPRFMIRDRDKKKEYIQYYSEDRTHLGLEKDCPNPREIESAELGPVQSKPMVGGLHHRCYRQAA